MSVTPTYLTVTPTWENKRLTIEGSVSVRETVALTLVGCASDTSIVFKISSENGRVDYAKFPNAPGDAWVVSGSDLTATLSLNTTLLVAAFAPWGPEDRLGFYLSVASATNSNLYAGGCKQIGNWMEDTDDPVAYSTPLADAVEEVEGDLADLEANFGSHLHDGTAAGGPRVPHGNLLGIGVNTHAAIDAALTTLTSGVATNASNIAGLGAIGVDHEERLDAIEAAIAADTITALPASVDDTDFADIYNTLASVLAFVASMKASQT